MRNLFLVDDAECAPEMSAALPDAEERERALDIRRSWAVEAPAGSGKTGLLIQRYLKLLADDSVVEPEQVLAITFTRKATAELRERVVAQLQAANTADLNVEVQSHDPFKRETLLLARAVLQRDRRLKWSLLDQPHRLSIRTIDSVCSEIAGSLPLLSGGGGLRTPVDNADPLYALAARQTFLQLGGSNEALDKALKTILLHRDGDLANCEQLVAKMLSHREQWGELLPLKQRVFDDAWLDAEVLPRLERALDKVICTALTELTKTMPAKLLDELTLMATEMAHLEGYAGNVSPIAICAERHRSPAKTADDLEHWQALLQLLTTSAGDSWRKRFNSNDVKFSTGKAERERLDNFVQKLQGREDLRQAVCAVTALPPARYPADQWKVAKALFHVLKRAMVELQLVFAERGECDYTELALAAKTALRSEDGSRDLESALGIHLQHLLVDEMQDTSSSQHELLRMLTEGWDGCSQTVFLVGDPKQSIYLFRQARVERFLRLMRSGQLGELPLDRLRLTANFRSQKTLVDEFNVDFSQVFPSEESAAHPEEVPYAGVSAMRPENQHARGRVWHANALPKPETTKDGHRNKIRRRAKDAAEIRRILLDWQGRPLPKGRDEPWSMAVLVRSRNHLEQIAAALNDERMGEPIPFRAVEIEPLKDRAEVRDLFALTRALLHPADRVAWLSVLRAPWCGFTLAELHTLAGDDNHDLAEQSMRRVLAERGDLLGTEACERLERVWTALQAGAELAGRQPISEVVERTWRSLGGDAYCHTSELANARRYLESLDEMEQQAGAIDLNTLEGLLEHLFAAPRVESGALDLLTIYKAKGLEWDVVIVPSLERRVNQNPSRLLNWLELDSADEQAAHILLAPIVSKGETAASDPLVTWIRNVHTARETAEYKRLLYVACTRAKEELHLFASPTRSSDGTLKPEKGSLLEAAWPAAASYFAAMTSIAPPGSGAEPLPHPIENEAESTGLAIAASTADPVAPSRVERLPNSFDLASRFVNPQPLSYGQQEVVPALPSFERPEGSFAARALGNTVHAFLEQLATRLAAREQSTGLLASLPKWAPRISAVLRAEGLQPAAVERHTQRVLLALQNTLRDPQGLWALSPHDGAETESALTTWQQRQSTIRVDRMFRAGPEPLRSGNDCLWIIDYKTTTHGTKDLEQFLEEERGRYAPQLQAYAEVLAADWTAGAASMRLALYYPLLQRIVWWTPQQALDRQPPRQLSLLW